MVTVRTKAGASIVKTPAGYNVRSGTRQGHRVGQLAAAARRALSDLEIRDPEGLTHRARPRGVRHDLRVRLLGANQ
jgi:hypothetical protein